MAVVDYFLKLDGIQGESMDAQHKGEIEIKAFSFGVSNSVRFGSGGGAGKVSLHDLNVTKRTDKSSPTLFLRCASGAHIKKAELFCRKAGGDAKATDFLKVTFSDVLISGYLERGQTVTPVPPPSVDVVAPPGEVIVIGDPNVVGPDQPVDSVSLRYGQLQVSMNAQTFNVPAASIGQIRFDPATGRATAYDAPNGIMAVGTIGGMTVRAVQEFDIANLIGLLTAPFSTARLTLSIAEVRRPPSPQDGNTILDRDDLPEPIEVRPPKLPRYDVIIYTPADGTITVDDLTRHGTRIGTITVDPNADPVTLDIDLMRFLRQHHVDLSTFGVRLQLRGASAGRADDDEKDDDRNDDGQKDDTDDGDRQQTGERDDHKPSAPPPDVSARFTIDLVLDTA